MPLIEGYSREAISANIRREMHRGADQDQAVAIALNTARRAYRARHPRGRLPAHLRSNPTMPYTYRRRRRRTRRNPSVGDLLMLGFAAYLVLAARSSWWR